MTIETIGYLAIASLIVTLLLFVELKRLEPSILSIGQTSNTVNGFISGAGF